MPTWRPSRGHPALDVVYGAGTLAVNGTAGLTFASPDVGDSGLALSLAGGVLFPILTSDRADLWLGGRLHLAAAKNFDPQFTLEPPLRIEWYASEHFSPHGEVGVAIEIVGDRGRLLGGAGILSTSSGGTGFIVGGTLVTAGGGFDVSF